MLSAEPAERHRTVAATFTSLVDGVTDWNVPSPVAGWTARGVVEHLTTWLPSFVHAGSPYGWTQRHAAVTDPVGSWAEQRDAVQRLLDDPAQAESPFLHPRMPPGPLGEVLDRFYTPDVFMHAWDLARASGQQVDLDSAYASELLTTMRAMEDQLRASGQYGPAVAVSADAGPVDQLMAFVGRDPHWTP